MDYLAAPAFSSLTIALKAELELQVFNLPLWLLFLRALKLR
jgi:hypothetical protein